MSLPIGTTIRPDEINRTLLETSGHAAPGDVVIVGGRTTIVTRITLRKQRDRFQVSVHTPQGIVTLAAMDAWFTAHDWRNLDSPQDRIVFHRVFNRALRK